jgi:hypothetical protein
VLWVAVTVVALSGLWALTIEIAYRQNMSRLPALIDFHRHVITRMSKA